MSLRLCERSIKMSDGCKITRSACVSKNPSYATEAVSYDLHIIAIQKKPFVREGGQVSGSCLRNIVHLARRSWRADSDIKRIYMDDEVRRVFIVVLIDRRKNLFQISLSCRRWVRRSAAIILGNSRTNNSSCWKRRN